MKRRVSTYCDLTPLLKDELQSFYWIGFIMADGWINHKKYSISLSMSVLDLDQLRRYARFVNATEHYDPPSKTKGLCFDSVNKEVYRVIARHKEVVTQFIARFSLVPKKTYYPPNLDYILNSSDDLFLAFLTGFIDGDGSIISVPTHYSLSLRLQNHCSWIGILESFEDRIYKILNETKSIAKMGNYTRLARVKSNTAILSIAKYNVIKSLYDKIKGLNIPYLQRKWNKIDEYPTLTKGKNIVV